MEQGLLDQGSKAGVTLWERLMHVWSQRRAGRRFFALDADLANYVYLLAEQEGRSPHEVASELLADGLAHRNATTENMQRWQGLSGREQEVTALACLGYSNAQIGYRLVITRDTVKTHMHHAMQKFGVRNRGELRMLLKDWDFSEWR
jgi:DNA-binding CsgD family transcriptional regulator